MTIADKKNFKKWRPDTDLWRTENKTYLKNISLQIDTNVDYEIKMSPSARANPTKQMHI